MASKPRKPSKFKYRVEFDMVTESGDTWTSGSYHATREAAEARRVQNLAWFETPDFNRGSDPTRCVASRIIER